MPLVEKSKTPFISLAVIGENYRSGTEMDLQDVSRRPYGGSGKSGRGQSLALAPKYGLGVVADESYGKKDTDMTTQRAKIRNTDAQAILNFGFGSGPAIVTKNACQRGKRVARNGTGKNLRYLSCPEREVTSGCGHPLRGTAADAGDWSCPAWTIRPLLLDEPSMGLAPLLVAEIFRVIREMNKKGVTILLVEQNTRAALSIANRGHVMETGSVVLSADADELLADETVQRAYLGY